MMYYWITSKAIKSSLVINSIIVGQFSTEYMLVLFFGKLALYISPKLLWYIIDVSDHTLLKPVSKAYTHILRHT